MSAVHLDTHVVVWLYAPLLDRLAPALRHLEGRELVVSPMVVLELQYLHEVGRLTVPANSILEALRETAGLSVAQSSWEQVVRTALPLSWTRDPFDRLIVAHAAADGQPLVTADERIRAHYTGAVWN